MAMQNSVYSSVFLAWNSWIFEIFFQGPGKPWKLTPGILWEILYQFYKQSKTCISISLKTVLFVFYVNSISIADTVIEITYFVFTERENLGLSPCRKR